MNASFFFYVVNIPTHKNFPLYHSLLGNTLYQTQLIFNNISVKFSRYFEETLQIWGDISISAESASIDRKVSHASSIQVIDVNPHQNDTTIVFLGKKTTFTTLSFKINVYIFL
jgi:hypothetical protein